MIDPDFAHRRIQTRGYITGKRPVGIAAENHHTAFVFRHFQLLVVASIFI
jgi:hypothetical protein